MTTLIPAEQRSTGASAMPLPADRSGDAVIFAEGLVKSFGGQRVLDGVNLCLRRGEVALLRGENGSGKTTLLNVLTGNLAPDAGQIEYCVSGVRCRRSFPRPLFGEFKRSEQFSPEVVSGLGVGRSWQDVRLFRTQPLRNNIAVADPRAADPSPLDVFLRPREMARIDADIFATADATLARLGLGDRRHSSADMVSLGQSKRVAIARAVAAGASVLLLDEPLAGLDQQGVDDVVALLESLVEDSGVTLVIVEHVFSHVHLQRIVTTHWHLSEGRLVQTSASADREGAGRTASVTPEPADTSALNAWSALASDSASVRRDLLPRGASLTRIQMHPEAQTAGNVGPVLECNKIIVRRGARLAVGLDDQQQPAGFSLQIRPGEVLLLQAPNGWGKTTLFDAICGNEVLSAGTLWIKGQDATTMPTWNRCEQGLSACQAGARLFGRLDVDEVSQLARLPDGCLHHLSHLKGKRLDEMSGGERQLVAVSIAIETARIRPGLLLLDEPLAMLDASAIRVVLDRLSTLSSAVIVLMPAAQ